MEKNCAFPDAISPIWSINNSGLLAECLRKKSISMSATVLWLKVKMSEEKKTGRSLDAYFAVNKVNSSWEIFEAVSLDWMSSSESAWMLSIPSFSTCQN